MKISSNNYLIIVNELLSPSGHPQIFTLTLSQFREVYNEIQSSAPTTPVDILLNGDWAMAQFSRLCNHRIRIIFDPPPKYLFWVKKRRTLTEKHFEFASLYSKFYGARNNLSIGAFILEEISTNWLPISITFVIAYIAFRALLFAPNGMNALEKISESVVTASTLFLSIFILFTVSQNAELVKDSYLFREGLTHRFFQVDRILASLALIALLISILTLVLINLPTTVIIFGKIYNLPNSIATVPIFSSISLSILVDCFLSLVKYYFKRVRYIFEKDLTKELFDERWDLFKKTTHTSKLDIEDNDYRKNKD